MAIITQASQTSSVKVLSASGSRKGLILCNDDANRCRVLLDSGTASATNYSFSLAQNENAGIYNIAEYTGEINVIWDGVGSGALKVTTW